MNNSQIEIYQTDDGLTRVDVRMDEDTVWLTQAQMVELFQSSKANVSEHEQEGVCIMEIKIIKNSKKDFLDLLFLADQPEKIDKYLDRGTLFALYDDDLKSICVVTDEGNGCYEIQNLATYEQFQRKGYGRHLVNHVCDFYREKGNTMLVGTSDVSFYVSL